MTYFVTLLRYIHQNPIAAGIAPDVRHYPWSSWCEYQTDMMYIIPICTTQHVFARLSAEDLTALVNEPLSKTLKILDFDNEMAIRLSDDKVREFLLTACGVTNVVDIQHYPKETRNDIIKQLRDYGASIRQITRIIGISEGIIRKIK